MSKSAEKEDLPLVKVGDKIKLKWSEDDGNSESRTVHARVQSVEKSSKKKHGTYWKYELCLYKENDAVISTRLVNLPWELKKKSKRTADEVEGDAEQPIKDSSNKKSKVADSLSTIPPSISTVISHGKRTVAPESLRYIVAPMVGGSELAFRLLCRKYGATIAYTPMMNSEKFAVDAEYRKAEFQTIPQDRPLVAHFSANDPKFFLQAARHVQDQCDAIGT